MSFQQGLSGLNVASKSLDVIGNNIANSGVAGFKGSTAQFGDVFASASGGSSTAVGIGAQLQAVAQQFSQGNITATGNPLDLAVNGGGFFRMSDNGNISYSRNGQFHTDKLGQIINTSGQVLTGYAVNAAGVIQATTPVPLVVSSAALAPLATTQFVVGLNLDATEPIRAGVFNANDTTTYNKTTSGTLYDSLGGAHIATLYFQKTAANTWATHLVMDGAVSTVAPVGAVVGVDMDRAVAAVQASSTLAFTTSGALSSAMPLTIRVDLDAVALQLGTTNSAPQNLDFSIDFTGSTQYGNPFSVSKLTQDGYASGRLSSIGIGGDGIMTGHYSNGQTQNLGQVVLASFPNPNALASIGSNQWKDNSESGLPIIGVPGTGTLGALQASAIEESNVDLTAELVNMITAQRIYQANAQSIKTQDSVLQTLVNLR